MYLKPFKNTVETVESIEARRLVEKWLLPENRQSAAAASSLAAFGASGPNRYQQSEERTDEMITRELGGKNRLFEPDTTDLYLLLGKNRVERFGGGQDPPCEISRAPSTFGW